MDDNFWVKRPGLLKLLTMGSDRLAKDTMETTTLNNEPYTFIFFGLVILIEAD